MNIHPAVGKAVGGQKKEHTSSYKNLKKNARRNNNRMT